METQRWPRSTVLGLDLLIEMEYTRASRFGEESSELYFEVREIAKWRSSVDGWEQGFVASEEVWDEILGELSAFWKTGRQRG